MPALFRLSLLASLLVASPLSAQDTPDLLVSSRGTHSILRFDGETGALVGTFVAAESGGLNTPQEVRFHADGDLLVTGRFNDAVLKFDGQTGEFVGPFTSGYVLQEPTKMAFGPDGSLYISQWGGQMNKVVRFDGETGEFIDGFTAIDLNLGMGHAWDDEGILYVASFGSQNVQRFDVDGFPLGEFAKSNLSGPVNLWFGEGGDLFVQDWSSGSIERFDGETGEFIETFVSGMTRTEGYAFSTDNLLYACDWQANEVNRYNATTGEFVDTFIDAGGVLSQPNSIIFMQTPSVPNEQEASPSPTELGQSFPNPALDTATIRYILSVSAHVSLRVFDPLGREVATLVDGFRPAGIHEAAFERGALPAGLYVYRIVTSDRIESHHLTFVR